MDRNRIFITGGASGLGLALARQCAAEGWKVCIGDLNEARGKAAQNELAEKSPDSCFLPCDVRREEDLLGAAEQLTRRWGGVDVVVNNAGVALAGSIEEVSLEEWSWILDINLLGVVRGCKAFTPLFKRQGSGYFVNVASMAGLLDMPLMSAYNASKAAVVSLSETLQVELASHNIGVSVVCPSFFRTNLGDSLRASDPQMRSRLEQMMERSPITAEDIARQILGAIQSREFYVLPHPRGRQAWMLKRSLSRTDYLARMLDALRW